MRKKYKQHLIFKKKQICYTQTVKEGIGIDEKRSLEILNLILNTKQGISGKELATKLHVSSRTIRNDIHELNSELISLQCKIDSSPASGYLISSKDKAIIFHYLKNKESSLSFYPNTPSERELYISLKLLLEKKQNQTIENLADSIFVSKTTIFSDIKHLNESYGKTNFFEIVYSASRGIYFNGKESDLRLFLSYIISHNYESNLPYLKHIIKYFLDYEDELLFQLYNRIMQILDTLHIVLVDKDLYIFIIEYLITLRRNQLGYELEPNCPYTTEFPFFHFPYKDLTNFTGLPLSLNDEYFLDHCFSFKRFLSNSTEIIKDNVSQSIINEYIHILKRDYLIDLNNATNLKENLMQHLNTMLKRIQFDNKSKSALISDIKILYPYSFELATAIIPIIKKVLNKTISEAELSYIAIHLTAILDKLKPKYNTIVVFGLV